MYDQTPDLFYEVASIDYPIIDSDAHVNEPPDLWQSRSREVAQPGPEGGVVRRGATCGRSTTACGCARSASPPWRACRTRSSRRRA